MNDSMILIARLRRGEMIREANQGRLAAAVTRLRHRRPPAAQMRPTVDGTVRR